jgi:hypothetical protein
MAQEMLGGMGFCPKRRKQRPVSVIPTTSHSMQHGYRLRCVSCKQRDSDGCVVLKNVFKCDHFVVISKKRENVFFNTYVAWCQHSY